MPWGGEPAEAKRSKARSQGKACWHRGSGKQEEKRGSRGRIRDHRMRPAGIWAESKRTEPTGFESSVTNFFPLPFPFWEIVSKGAAPARLRRKELREALLLL